MINFISMKKLPVFFFIFLIIIAGCKSKELSREEAFRLIQQKQQYPKVIDFDIYCSDPKYAKKAVDVGLEVQGMVTIQHIQKLADVGNPLIKFTPKAQAYLLPTPSKDKAIDVQKVKIADADLAEVTGIKTENDGKNAVAEFTVTYKNITPFSALTTINFNKKSTHTVLFSLYDDGWRLDK